MLFFWKSDGWFSRYHSLNFAIFCCRWCAIKRDEFMSCFYHTLAWFLFSKWNIFCCTILLYCVLNLSVVAGIRMHCYFLCNHQFSVASVKNQSCGTKLQRSISQKHPFQNFSFEFLPEQTYISFQKNINFTMIFEFLHIIVESEIW